MRKSSLDAESGCSQNHSLCFFSEIVHEPLFGSNIEHVDVFVARSGGFAS